MKIPVNTILKLIFFTLLVVFIQFSYAQSVILYSEDFSTNDGKGQNAACNPCTTGNDMDGVTNWTIDVSNTTFSSGDHFKVTGGYFESFNTDAASTTPVYWYSTVVDIDCYDVSVSVDLGRNSSNSGSGCEAFYQIDGGSWVSFGSKTGSGGTEAFETFSASSLSGSTIQIRVAHWGTSSTPSYRHDNVLITGTLSPATSPSGFTLSNHTGTEIDLSWTNGSGDRVIVVAKENGTSVSHPVTGTTYTANAVYGSGEEIGTGNFVVYDGTGTSETVTGLTNGTEYDFSVYTYESGVPCYNTSSAFATTVCTAPTTSPTNCNITSVGPASMNVAWDTGNGDRTIVVARQSGTAQSEPVPTTAYTANSVFGSGDEIGTDNFVVYNGTGTDVTITALSPGTNYIFSIYTYNIADNCYNLTELSCSETTTTTSTYEIDVFNGSTINTCSGTFTDSNSAGNYGNDENYVVTFCSNDGDLLKFDFSSIGVVTGDYLNLYDGTSTSDPLIVSLTGNGSNRFDYFDNNSTFTILSANSCITFEFISNSSGVAAGWSASISCIEEIGCSSNPDNPDPSDLFGSAPYVCNLDGYCGITSSNYDEDYPADLNSSGGNCPSTENFLGTIENNSWIRFIATAEDVTFNFNVPTGGSCLNGIQVAILSYNEGANTLTRMSDCALSDGSHSGLFDLTASGLTIGEEYYIMTDGNAGDICQYTITADTGVGVAPDNSSCADAMAFTCGDSDIANTWLDVCTDESGVWYSFTGTGNDVTISTENDDTDVDFNSEIIIYSGTCGTLVQEYISNGVGGTTIDFTATNGTTYYVYVNGYSGDEGQFEISMECCIASSGTWVFD